MFSFLLLCYYNGPDSGSFTHLVSAVVAAVFRPESVRNVMADSIFSRSIVSRFSWSCSIRIISPMLSTVALVTCRGLSGGGVTCLGLGGGSSAVVYRVLVSFIRTGLAAGGLGAFRGSETG
jgi:hypothetical protein